MPLRGEWEGVAKPWLLERKKKGSLSVLGGSTSAVLYMQSPHCARIQLGLTLPSKINYRCPC